MESNSPHPLDVAEHRDFVSLCSELKNQARLSLRLFSIENDATSTKFTVVLDQLLDHLDSGIIEHCNTLYSRSYQYDFADVRANGYRSFLKVTSKCCANLLQQIRKLKNDNSYSNWLGTTYSNLSAYVNCLGELNRCLQYESQMHLFSAPGCLFPKPEAERSLEFQRLILESDTIAQEVFYGRCIGFHYCQSARRILKMLGCVMAGYSASFTANKSGLGAVANTIMNTVHYNWNQEDRGRQIAEVTREATVDFCKSFWNLGEHPVLLEAPNMILPPVDVAATFQIPWVGFQLQPGDVQVPVASPAACRGEMKTPGSVSLRLLSLRARKGMHWLVKTQPQLKPSPYLLLHCHGGGFVAQSAQAHDVYLRTWAEELDCPILSVDYSLAPAAPYPRAMEEVMYAYCWAVKNCRQLGSTGEKILLCGDSAGGNLIMGATLKAIELGVRPPHALFVAYAPTIVGFTPSPSRILSNMDPLLPVGILVRCLLAYAGIDERKLPHNPHPKSKDAKKVSDTDNSFYLVNEHNFSASEDPTPVPTPAKTFWERLRDFGQALDADMRGRDHSLSKSVSTPDLNGLNHSPEHTKEMGDREVKKVVSPLTRVRYAEIPDDPYMSPLLASDELLRLFPPIGIMGCHMDPLLDDCIELAKRLARLNKSVQVRVMDDVPHGFLNFVLMSEDCRRGGEQCLEMIRQLLEQDPVV